jgi:hypothetical protein
MHHFGSTHNTRTGAVLKLDSPSTEAMLMMKAQAITDSASKRDRPTG